MQTKFVLSVALSILCTVLPMRAQQQFEDQSVEIAGFSHKSFTGLGSNGDGIAGAAWLDYNRDGFLDLFLTNGKGEDNALFHNNGDGSFTDVATAAGVANGLGNSGVVAADLDNDGFEDLLVTGDGGWVGSGDSPIILYRNLGNDTFSDVTAASGITGPATHASPTVGDIDSDGLLDVYIAAIGSFVLGVNHKSELYRNLGGMTFQNISASSGVDTMIGACEAIFTDYNRDELVDLFVGNCNGPNLSLTPIEVFTNNGNLTFDNDTATVGLAAGGLWMGLCPADFDNDGDTDMFTTNYGSPLGGLTPHALYSSNLSQGSATFTDVAASAGVASGEFGWGCSSSDFDNDGWADIFFAGSLPLGPFPAIGSGSGNAGRLFRNNQDFTFADITAMQPLDLSDRYTSGVATADYDNDGYEDLVVMTDDLNNDMGRPVLYRNLASDGNNWLQVELRGTVSNRDAIGARVRVRSEGLTQIKEIYGGSSFLSTNSKILTFGLGDSTNIQSIFVRWPNGLEETFAAPGAVNTKMTLVEGSGYAPNVDPFKCYKVKDLKNPKFTKTTVALQDQFEINDGNFDVIKPFLLCNPANVDGEGIVNQADHLTCYKSKGPKLDPDQRPRVQAFNQLGPLELEAKKAFLLCIPSSKTVLP